jgi:hypothetical protein
MWYHVGMGYFHKWIMSLPQMPTDSACAVLAGIFIGTGPVWLGITIGALGIFIITYQCLVKNHDQ